MIFYFNFRKRWNYKWIKWSNLKYIYSFHFEITFSWKIQIFSGQVPGAGSSLKGSFSWSSSLTSSSSRQIATRFQQVNGMSIYMESSELQVNWPNVSASEQVKWKKTLQLWFKWEKNQVKWFSSERIVKLPVCQVKGVCQAKSRSSESWIKWRLGQVKGQSSANLVKWKGWSSDYLLLWKVHQVNTLSSERLVKWMFGQVRSICNTTTPGTWKHIYIYTHKNMNR